MCFSGYKGDRSLIADSVKHVVQDRYDEFVSRSIIYSL